MREDFVLPNGERLVNVHEREDCAGRPCVIHAPTDHYMRDWPLAWRNDIAVFERLCHHDIGHPDPDQFAYWEETGQTALAVHGCDGCCTVITDVTIRPYRGLFYVTMGGPETPFQPDSDVWFESDGEATHYALGVAPLALLNYAPEPKRSWKRFFRLPGVRP